MNDLVLKSIVGKHCRELRTQHDGLTLQNFSIITGVKLKTLSAFENGRSSNILIFLHYYGLIETSEERIEFIEKILTEKEG